MPSSWGSPGGLGFWWAVAGLRGGWPATVGASAGGVGKIAVGVGVGPGVGYVFISFEAGRRSAVRGLGPGVGRPGWAGLGPGVGSFGAPVPGLGPLGVVLGSWHRPGVPAPFWGWGGGRRHGEPPGGWPVGGLAAPWGPSRGLPGGWGSVPGRPGVGFLPAVKGPSPGVGRSGVGPGPGPVPGVAPGVRPGAWPSGGWLRPGRQGLKPWGWPSWQFPGGLGFLES